MTARATLTRTGRSIGCAACLAIMLAAACACAPPGAQNPSPGASAAAPGAPVVQATDVSAPAPAATAAATVTPGPVALGSLHLSLAKVVGGLAAPVYVTGAHDGTGRLFVVEQPGRIRIIKGGTLLSRAFLDVSKLVSYGGERGLLGLAFAPDYAKSGRFYIDYTDVRGNTVIARYRALTPTADAPTFATPERLLYIGQPYSNHNGGCLQFGPDGFLYIGMGDGGSGGDPGNRAQNPRVLLGKILRIGVSHATGWVSPASNPRKPGWLPPIASIGVRNPWRFSFDASSGAMWMGDVGQNRYEEIDYAPKGKLGQNWGWHYWEAMYSYPPGARHSTAGFTFPLYFYSHPFGEAVIGGYVYHGAAYPAMQGTYLFADLNGWLGGIRITAPDGTPLAKRDVRVLLTGTGTTPTSFGVSDTGELYLTDLRGNLYRVVGTGP